METCKTIYGHGIPHILDPSDDVTVVEDRRQISSFCCFMLAKLWSEFRWRNLTRLEMRSSESLPQKLATRIAQVIRRATNLDYLYLYPLDD